MFEEGYVLSNRYELVRKLGAGGMGVVWLARDREIGEEVALKVLPSEMAMDERAVRDLKGEVATARRLSHPNVVRVHDLGRDSDTYFITMEYVDGETLLERLTHLQEKEGRNFTVDELIEIAGPICEGLDYAHESGVIHRDIKPSNVMVTSSGNVKIMDFGIARTIKDTVSRLSQTRVMGTLTYMSPEQILGKKLDRRSDIYSLAATFYDLLAGHPPFATGAIEYQILNVAPEPIEGMADHINEAIISGLAKEPEERLGTTMRVLEKLTGEPLKVGVEIDERGSTTVAKAGTEILSVTKREIQPGGNDVSQEDIRVGCLWWVITTAIFGITGVAIGLFITEKSGDPYFGLSIGGLLLIIGFFIGVYAFNKFKYVKY